MPAPVRTSYDAWVDAGLNALAVGGPELVRVESVAAALGVTKGGFYHHFADRRALLAAMLARWESLLVDHAIEVVEDRGGDARDRLRTSSGMPAPRPICSPSSSRSATGRDESRRSRPGWPGWMSGGWTSCACCSPRCAGTPPTRWRTRRLAVC